MTLNSPWIEAGQGPLLALVVPWQGTQALGGKMGETRGIFID